MGDQGRLYVNGDVVPAYKKIIYHADLILPNQFEAEYVEFCAIQVTDGLTGNNLESSLELKLTPSVPSLKPFQSSTIPTPSHT